MNNYILHASNVKTTIANYDSNLRFHSSFGDVVCMDVVSLLQGRNEPYFCHYLLSLPPYSENGLAGGGRAKCFVAPA